MKKFSNLFTYDEKEFRRIITLYELGIYCVMNKRDRDGARIVIMKCKKIEQFKLSPTDLWKLQTFVYVTLENEPETQIAGVVNVFDCRDTSMAMLQSFPVKCIFEMLYVSKHIPCRTKAVHFIGLPMFARTIYDASHGIISAKLQNRVTILKNAKALCNLLGVSLLTEEYGGKLIESDCMEYFKDVIQENQDYFLTCVTNFDFDFDKYNEYNKDTEVIGSFRRLEID